jgi:hypothetical protein
VRSGGPPGRRPHHVTSPPPQQGPDAARVADSADSGRAPRGLAALLALSDERDTWLRRVYDAWRDGYRAALDDAVAESLARIWPPPGHVPEIERRRWGPGGREHFADPRPGDYPGRQHG